MKDINEHDVYPRTPGPWWAERVRQYGPSKHPCWTVQAAEGCIAEIKHTIRYPNGQMSGDEANARLMAASVELAATLREAQAILATLIDPASQHVSSQHIFAQATVAEAKARALLAKLGGEK